MAYISSDGRVIEKKPWSLGAVQDYFWGILSFFVFFFRGMFHMDEPSTKGQYGRSAPRTPGGRRMGGFRGGFSPAAPPCAPGGG